MSIFTLYCSLVSYALSPDHSELLQFDNRLQKGSMMSKGGGLSSTAVQNHHEKTPFGGNTVGTFSKHLFPGNPNIL